MSMNIVPLKRIELGFVPPFYIIRIGDWITLFDEGGRAMKPIFAPEQKGGQQE